MRKRTVQLGDVVKIVGGGTPRRDRPDYYGGSIPWMTVKDFGDGFSIRSTQECITQVGLDNSASRLIPAGNVIIGTRMSVGKATLNQIDLAINQDLKALLCRSELLPGYLTYFLASAAPGLEAKATGATVKGITIDEIQELEMPLPSLSEQRCVAAMLEQADQLRRTRRYALELSDAFLPAAFLEMFGDPAENPLGFGRIQVEQLFATDRAGAKCGPFGSALKNHEYTESGVPVWTMNNVGANEFKEEGCLFITEKKFEELSAYDVRNGDILISRAGTVGRMAIVQTKYPRSIIHTNIIRLSLNWGRVLPIYFVVLMTWFAARVAKLKRGQEDAYSFMSTGTLAELRIPVPPLSLQHRFADLVRGHERLRATQRESLRQAEHLFLSLLHRAFEE